MKNGMSVCFPESLRKIMGAGHSTVVNDPKGEVVASLYQGRSRGMCQVVFGLSSPPAFYSESYRLECVAALLKAEKTYWVKFSEYSCQ